MFVIENLYDIPDFTGYKADKQGHIYSAIPKGYRNRFDRTKWIAPQLLKEHKTKTGYCRVYMRRDSTGQREDVYIHRIIAEMFIPNPNSLSDVNHKDSNPSNNAVENLEWLSHRDNLEYGFKYGNKDRNFVQKNNSNKYGIVYSLHKYRETEGRKDIGSHYWNFGRTQEIRERCIHLGE